MTIAEIKRKARQFYQELNSSEIDYQALKNVIESLGYTVIEFNHIFNDTDVQTLIDNLKISDDILRSRGFTYADINCRLVFVHEDLSLKEKEIVLAHEAGHIYLGHLKSTPIIGKDVQEEFEANEFAHFLLNGLKGQPLNLFIKKHKKIICIVIAIVIVLTVGLIGFSHMRKQESYYGDYYITSTGNKYHEKECIFVKNKSNIHRLTKEEFDSGNYESCETCLP